MIHSVLLAVLCVVSVGLPNVDEFVTETSGMLQIYRSHSSCIDTCLYVLPSQYNQAAVCCDM